MARFDPRDPGADVLAFLAEYHLATLTVVTVDGAPHVTPVGVTYEPESRVARVITWEASWKVQHVRAHVGPAPVALCSVDGGRWLTLTGTATVTDAPEAVEEGVRRYAERYRQPADRPDRVVIEVSVESIMGRV